jgi:hypothetical protein
MKINHKFLTVNPQQNQLNWDNRFYTENAILKNIDIYKPEIMFLGTFNPQLPNNPADFFYGRNYFWTAFKNLFNPGQEIINEERLVFNPYIPTLEDIFQLCIRLKLTFSDLVGSIFDEHDNNQIFVRQNKDYIAFGNNEYNPISDAALQKINGINKINLNTRNIISYLNNNRQIRKIYLTRRNDLCWQTQINQISQAIPEIDIIPIYTPSAQGGALHQQTGIYGNGKMIPLLRHWTQNNIGNYGNLNHSNWLTNNGVDPNNF